jgi:accessory colonization factor AcfC
VRQVAVQTTNSPEYIRQLAAVLKDVVAALQNGGAGGEANTAANVGTGTGVFANKSGVTLNLKTLKAGTGITITSTGTEITISSSGGGGNSYFPSGW